MRRKSLNQSSSRVHFIGCGGIGVSALMRWFASQGWQVSGSDLQASLLTADLKREGMRIRIGHKTGNVPTDVSMAIYSQAIKPENPEWQRAKKLGIPLLSYPQAIGAVSRNYELVAVAGAHGKSTTTAMAALALINAKFDPTVIVGTKLKEFHGSNARLGKSQYFVLEADEYGRAFLNYSPAVAIVTNIDREHLDVYGTLAGVKKAFIQFFERLRPGGALILNRDDRNVHSLKSQVDRIARRNKLKVVWYSLGQNDAKKIRRVLKLPGSYNASNALAVFCLGKLLNIKESVLLGALGAYQGSWRRLELRGSLFGQRKPSIPIYDDYAHHPTEINATLVGLKEKYPHSELICVFQPHQARRLEALFPEFTKAFKAADTIVLLPFYKVAGRDEPTLKHSSEDLARAIEKQSSRQRVFYLENPKRIRDFFVELQEIFLKKKQPPVVVMMGAGDIFTYTERLI